MPSVYKYAYLYRWCRGTEWYEEGAAAHFDREESLDANPHKQGTKQWICWRAGWFDA